MTKLIAGCAIASTSQVTKQVFGVKSRIWMLFIHRISAGNPNISLDGALSDLAVFASRFAARRLAFRLGETAT
jgi:hypothetical protein